MTKTITDTIRAANAAADNVAADEAAYPTIIPELRDLLDSLRDEESAELEASIKREGVRDPIVVWKEKNAIMDGHNRTRIAKKLGIIPPRIELSYEDIEQVKEWMIQNQLGRRNLTPDRFEYLLGKLYNQKKQVSETGIGGVRTPMEGAKTAEQIANQFGVSERTVRRAGQTAVGLDKLEQIKGKIAKTRQLAGQGDYTKAELAQLGKQNKKVGERMLAKLDALKAKAKEEKAAQKAEQKTVDTTPVDYPVVFCEPDFGGLTRNHVKPALDKNAIVYMAVADEHLHDGLELLKKWGLNYECSFIFHGNATDDGVYSKITHSFMIVGTKGSVVGPKAGKEASSVHKVSGDPHKAIAKIIDGNHPGSRKLDFRKDARTMEGFDAYKIK